MEEERECPMCGHVMEWLEDTAWTDGRQRTMDVMCPNCLYRETVYFEEMRSRHVDARRVGTR